MGPDTRTSCLTDNGPPPLPRPPRRADNALGAVRLSPPSSAAARGGRPASGCVGETHRKSNTFNTFHGRISSCSDVLVFHVLNIREFPGSVWSFCVGEILNLLTLQFSPFLFSSHKQCSTVVGMECEVELPSCVPKEIKFPPKSFWQMFKSKMQFKLWQSKRVPTRLKKISIVQLQDGQIGFLWVLWHCMSLMDLPTHCHSNFISL